MKIASFDLARLTGGALGESSARPFSWTWELGEPGSDIGLWCGALARELEEFRKAYGIPDLAVIEHWLPPRPGMVDKNVEPSLRLNGAAHAIIGGVWGCRIVEPFPATVRAAVCGRANAGERKETKKMVLATVKLLGLLPANCFDDNRADALAGWHWASSVYGRGVPGGELVLM